MCSDHAPVVVILDPREYSEESLAMLSQAGELYLGADSGAHHHRATAVFVELGMTVDEDFLQRFPHLRYLVTPTTGMTHIDGAAARDRGVEIVALRRNAPELADVSATAELTWGLLLTLTRHIGRATQSVLRGNWQRQPHKGVELRGRTLGIVGLGRLGSHVARYGAAFGMRVLAHDANPEAFDISTPHVWRVSPEHLLEQSDVVSLHLPYISGQGPWLDASRVAQMRQGAILLNTARGELIDEEAVAAAVRCGAIGGLGVDVLVGDSNWSTHVQTANPIAQLAAEGLNVAITPHVGGFASPALGQARHLIAKDYLARLGT